MELTILQTVSLWGFITAVIFGAVAYKTNFCTMGAVSDWVNMGDKRRLRAWILAIAVAIVGTQYLVATDMIQFENVISLNPNFSWLACLVGGAIFGIGMTLGSGCGQRTLVRLGGGNLKSLLVVLVIAVTAFATFRGVLYFIPREWLWPVQINLAERGIADQSAVAIVSGISSMEASNTLRWLITGVIGAALLLYCFIDAQFRRSFDNILAGLVVGGSIVAGWYITGVLGKDEFEPVAAESMTFILPTGNTVNYLMTYTGASINFGIAAVLGLIAGSFLFSVLTRQFRFEGFSSLADMARHVAGGLLMGIGGVVGFGCTIGQGVTGLSTLSVGALLTFIGIVFGSALTMKIQYHQLEEVGFVKALTISFGELVRGRVTT